MIRWENKESGHREVEWVVKDPITNDWQSPSPVQPRPLALKVWSCKATVQSLTLSTWGVKKNSKGSAILKKKLGKSGAKVLCMSLISLLALTAGVDASEACGLQQKWRRVRTGEVVQWQQLSRPLAPGHLKSPAVEIFIFYPWKWEARRNWGVGVVHKHSSTKAIIWLKSLQVWIDSLENRKAFFCKQTQSFYKVVQALWIDGHVPGLLLWPGLCVHAFGHRRTHKDAWMQQLTALLTYLHLKELNGIGIARCNN